MKHHSKYTKRNKYTKRTMRDDVVNLICLAIGLSFAALLAVGAVALQMGVL